MRSLGDASSIIGENSNHIFEDLEQNLGENNCSVIESKAIQKSSNDGTEIFA